MWMQGRGVPSNGEERTPRRFGRSLNLGAYVLPIVLLACTVMPAVAQSILRVPADFPTIQAAIHAAMDGDTVVVSPGDYAEVIDFVGKAIIVESAVGPETTIIDANLATSAVTFQNGESSASILRGFTITDSLSQGVFISGASPLLEDLVIEDNRGGGLLVQDGGLTLRRSRIADNLRSSAITLRGAVGRIEWCEIDGQPYDFFLGGPHGGALHITEGSDVSIVGSTLTGVVGGTDNGRNGGAIYLSGNSVASISASTVSGEANYGTGGALHVTGDSAVYAKRTSFQGIANFDAGGVQLDVGSVGWFSECHFEGSETLDSRIAALLATDSLVTLEQCTFDRNRGDYSYMDPTAVRIDGGDVEVVGCHFLNSGDERTRHLELEACQSATIRDSVFEGGRTEATVVISRLGGGALRLIDMPDVHVSACDFLGNESHNGGAIITVNSTTRLEHLYFEQNIGHWGAAIGVDGGAVTATHIVCHDNTIRVLRSTTEPSGGVIAVDGDATFAGDFLMIGRTSVVLGLYSEPLATGLLMAPSGLVEVALSMILPDQRDTPIPAVYNEFGTPLRLDYCNVEGGWDGFGEGNIDLDPAFVDADAGDYRLKDGSPCINIGDPAFVPDPDAVDYFGNPRLSSCRVDIGVYEAVMRDLDVVIALTNPIRGERVSLFATCAEQGEEVIFYATGQGVGAGPSIPELGGLTLDLLAPVVEIGRSVVRADGIAQLDGRVRPRLGWRAVYVQAGIARGLLASDSVKSNVVGRRVLDP